MYYYKFHQYIARHDSSFAVLADLLISNNVDCLHRTLTECHVIVVNVTRQIFSHPDEVEKKKRERNQEKERISNEAERERQEPLKGLYIVGSRWRSLFRLALDVDREKSRRQTHKGEGRRRRRRRRSRKRERGLVEGSRSKRGPAVTRLGMGPHGVLASISTSIASFSSSFSFVTSFSFYIASRPLSLSLSLSLSSFLYMSINFDRLYKE